MISKMIRNILEYVGEGFARIFSPNIDEYPVIGVQPFSGEVYHPNSKFDW
ncbi:hypothetical protein [Myxosarcina sp. GI1(2024)]